MIRTVAELQEAATVAMKEFALELGVPKGVCVVLVTKQGAPTWAPCFLVVEGFERDPKANVANDPGANYGAIAWAKVMEMLSTLQDSGTTDRKPKKGELGLRGGTVGIFGDGYVLLAAFSGSSEDNDLLIAQRGMEILNHCFQKK